VLQSRVRRDIAKRLEPLKEPRLAQTSQQDQQRSMDWANRSDTALAQDVRFSWGVCTVATMTDPTDWRFLPEQPDAGPPIVFKDRGGVLHCGTFAAGRFIAVEAEIDMRCEDISAWAYLTESGVIAERPK
jgi:hypothetical protein